MALRTSAGACVTALPGAIVLGLENAIGLTVVRELGEHGVPVHGVAGDADSVGAASRHCTRSHLRPDGPAALWLPDLIARTGAGAVLAVSESDLLELAERPPTIGDCHILVPRPDRLAKVIIISSVAQVGSPEANEARALGAVEIIAKPSGTMSLDLAHKKGHDIVVAIRRAAGLPVRS